MPPASRARAGVEPGEPREDPLAVGLGHARPVVVDHHPVRPDVDDHLRRGVPHRVVDEVAQDPPQRLPVADDPCPPPARAPGPPRPRSASARRSTSSCRAGAAPTARELQQVVDEPLQPQDLGQDVAGQRLDVVGAGMGAGRPPRSRGRRPAGSAARARRRRRRCPAAPPPPAAGRASGSGWSRARPARPAAGTGRVPPPPSAVTDSALRRRSSTGRSARPSSSQDSAPTPRLSSGTTTTSATRRARNADSTSRSGTAATTTTGRAVERRAPHLDAQRVRSVAPTGRRTPLRGRGPVQRQRPAGGRRAGDHSAGRVEHLHHLAGLDDRQHRRELPACRRARRPSRRRPAASSPRAATRERVQDAGERERPDRQPEQDRERRERRQPQPQRAPQPRARRAPGTRRRGPSRRRRPRACWRR